MNDWNFSGFFPRSISWLQTIISLWPRRWPDAQAMFKIIDGSQIFHVISKIKSSNYRAHAYIFNSTSASASQKKLEWILMNRNLRANSLSRLHFAKLQQLYLFNICLLMSIRQLLCDSINKRKAWHHCEMDHKASRQEPQEVAPFPRRSFSTHQNYKSQFRHTGNISIPWIYIICRYKRSKATAKRRNM